MISRTGLTCRLLLDSAAAGAWNMAVDEALLDAAAEGETWLRIYSWQDPTVSLGYFQAYDDRRSHAASLACPVVRRLTGGGAIVHDRELTYSLALAAHHPLAKDALGLYREVHAAVTDVLGRFGIALTAVEGEKTSTRAAEPFLCFERRSPGDLVWHVYKLLGSAQRRRRGAVLLHGSLLLGESRAAPGLLGLDDLFPKAVKAGLLAEKSASAIAGRLAFAELAECGLNAGNLARVRELATGKYMLESWNRRR